MKTSLIRSPFFLPNHFNSICPIPKASLLLPFITAISCSKHKHQPSNSFSSSTGSRAESYSKHRAVVQHPAKFNGRKEPFIFKPLPDGTTELKNEVLVKSSDGYSRFVKFGVVSIGLVFLVAGILDDQKALALGPEGPLVEEFWDNVRRYGLYILTVSTGVIYTIFEPIFELLKNPITAILILVILGGSVYIVSQVVSAMVGVSDFAYEYAY